MDFPLQKVVVEARVTASDGRTKGHTQIFKTTSFDKIIDYGDVVLEKARAKFTSLFANEADITNDVKQLDYEMQVEADVNDLQSCDFDCDKLHFIFIEKYTSACVEETGSTCGDVTNLRTPSNNPPSSQRQTLPSGIPSNNPSNLQRESGTPGTEEVYVEDIRDIGGLENELPADNIVVPRKYIDPMSPRFLTPNVGLEFTPALLRAVLQSREYDLSRLLAKYDRGETWTISELHLVKRYLGTWLLQNCKKRHFINRRKEMAPFCEAFLLAFPRQKVNYILSDLMNKKFLGLFDSFVRNKKMGPGYLRRPYRKANTQNIVPAPSEEELENGMLYSSKLKKICPTAENKTLILKYHNASRPYRREIIISGKLEKAVLDAFPRLKDCSYLFPNEFDKHMEGQQENITAAQLAQNWTTYVTPILQYAMEKIKTAPNLSKKFQSVAVAHALWVCDDVDQIPLGDRSEIAFTVLPFLAPACGKLKCQVKTLNKLMLVYENASIEQVKASLPTLGVGPAPLLIKLTSGEQQNFFIAVDGQLVSTSGDGDATNALVMLCMSYFVLWLDYPAELKHFYRFMEQVMGLKRGLHVSTAMKTFLAELKGFQPAQAHPSRGVDDRNTSTIHPTPLHPTSNGAHFTSIRRPLGLQNLGESSCQRLSDHHTPNSEDQLFDDDDEDDDDSGGADTQPLMGSSAPDHRFQAATQPTTLASAPTVQVRPDTHLSAKSSTPHRYFRADMHLLPAPSDENEEPPSKSRRFQTQSETCAPKPLRLVKKLTPNSVRALIESDSEED